MQLIKIKPDGLKNKLVRGEVTFTFTKVDGTLREARGTTKLDDIPDNLHPKNPVGKYVAYFDTDKKEWRSVAEGQGITMTIENLMFTYGQADLTEEEISLMLYVNDDLQDKWTSSLIGLIMTASDQQSSDLSLGFENLVRATRKYVDDQDYAEDLRQKWNKLTNE